ncbi:MAG: membrane-bound lytic murein transglycosylase MltF [Deltaproteobacteria bacterium]|nr:membrane-bound lytic murein transglycosylase MltF [Deltaproteobacteria bacterium]
MNVTCLGVFRLTFLTIILMGSLFLTSSAREDALQNIRASGKITVLTRNNAHCYYVYRGEPMGFEYDLAKAFSDYLHVKLNVATPTWEGLIQGLEAGEGDFVAASMSITKSRLKRVDFSDAYLPVQQYIILNKDDHAKTIDDLAGKTFCVRKGTTYEELLHDLQSKGLKIKIKLYDDMPTEELIRMVADKEIEATVADSHIALLNRRYYPEARIAFPLGKPSNLGWAVRKGEKRLLEEINSFFARVREDGTFDRVYAKYFANIESFDYVDLKRYYRRLETRLPRYRETIQKAAEKYGFDWRLIAAMIYQESHFNPRAKSYTGVRGLMQVTLETAKEVGIESRLDPEQSILGGVKYLKKSYDKFEGVPEPDRLLMALASYNVGFRHVQDAQKIAKEMDYDPNSWAALKEALPLLCHRKYYKKSRAGYCRGRDAVRYVDRIITYYDILKRDAIS